MTAVHAFPDVIDQLVGVKAGGPIDQVRARRPLARLHAQQSYQALFEPAAPPPGHDGAFSAVERFVVATFTAALHRQPAFIAFYATGLSRAGASTALQETVIAAAEQGAASGPYGSYPAGALSAEDVQGPDYVVSAEHRAVLGVRLAAALAHAHLLVLSARCQGRRPASLARRRLVARRDRHRLLRAAGWARAYQSDRATPGYYHC